MSQSAAVGPPGKGILPAVWSIQAINRTGATLSRGHCACIDFLGTGEGGGEVVTTAYMTGGDDDPLANVVNLVAANVTGANGAISPWAAIAVIADEDIADNAAGKFWVRGPSVYAAVTGATDAGMALTVPVTAGSVVLQDLATSVGTLTVGQAAKIVGLAHNADAPTGFAYIMFDGYSGFGMIHEEA